MVSAMALTNEDTQETVCDVPLNGSPVSTLSSSGSESSPPPPPLKLVSDRPSSDLTLTSPYGHIDNGLIECHHDLNLYIFAAIRCMLDNSYSYLKSSFPFTIIYLNL